MLAYQIHNTAGKDEKFSWLSKTGKYTNTSNRECQNEQCDYDQQRQEKVAINGSEYQNEIQRNVKYTNTQIQNTNNEQQEEMAVNGSETAKISFPTKKER